MEPNSSTKFVCLLIDENLIFTEWHIESQVWEKQKAASIADYQGDPFLFLEVWIVMEGRSTLCTEYPVYGRENRWHIFVTGEFAGRRVRLSLTAESLHGYRVIIAESGEIDVPLSGAALDKSLRKNGVKDLYDISGAGGETGGSSSSS
ncbi:MAG: hypothetical protein EPN93_08040 [Spirochaetes bacterium]|nr:MAG: hypothetical protein EPN93_08040 [Spirochaetota bacterium]